MPEKRWRKLALPLLGSTIQHIGWNVYLVVLLPSFAALHGHMDNYGMVVATNAAAIALLSIPGGRLSDVLGRRRMIFIGWSIVTLSPLFLLSTSGFSALILSSAVNGCGVGLSQSAFQSYIAVSYTHLTLPTN